MSSNLTVDLDKTLDKNGKKYFIGKLKFPGEIDCRDGVTFLIFVSEEGEEELQISVMEKKEKKDNKTEVFYVK